MQITIKSKNDITDFVYDYLPSYIRQEYLDTVDIDRLKIIDSYFNINSFKLMNYYLQHLVTSKVGNTYIVQENKNLKYKGQLVFNYIQAIAYGNREVKGYPIIKDIFKYVSSNINYIYEEWEDGY